MGRVSCQRKKLRRFSLAMIMVQHTVLFLCVMTVKRCIDVYNISYF